MSNAKGSEWTRWDLHLHTASSYDYKYKAKDADEILCKSLKENEIKAVAITDHFIIDHERIKSLREIAPEITFFPGVELRTDKGANNLHVILIFSETCDVGKLSNSFDVIMRQEKAKSSSSNETIYWTFEDIIDFAHKYDGLISIHAGKKSNGIDSEITNAVPYKEAIKEDIAGFVDFFEMGKKSDIDDYKKYVFKDIEEKPLIICSDNHDSRSYLVKEKLWIKAEPTFAGLKQCLFQPNERVFVGDIPQLLERVHKGTRFVIDRINVQKVNKPKNTAEDWFDLDLKLNPGLIAIIGNKGSGKSALADIIGHLCQSITMKYASFLNDQRFRKLPQNYSADYIAKIIWKDSHEEESLLSLEEYSSVIENAQYLPQRYIEQICNEIGGVFQNEIDKVIFSYVDITERADAKDLKELVAIKSQALLISLQKIQNELDSINDDIIKLEYKLKSEYKRFVKDSLKKMQEALERHEKSKPAEVEKPSTDDKNSDYQDKLNKINEKINNIQAYISSQKSKLTKINSDITSAEQIIQRIELIEQEADELNSIIKEFDWYQEITDVTDISLSTPKEKIRKFINYRLQEKEIITVSINGNSSDIQGLNFELEDAQDEKNKLISTADSAEQKYQKYLADVGEWEKSRLEIIGDVTIDGSLKYYENELDYVINKLSQEYTKRKQQRNEVIQRVFAVKQQLVDVYKQIYAPIQFEIERILGELDEKIEFLAMIKLNKEEDVLTDKILSYINMKYSGIFKGKAESGDKMKKLIRSTNFSDFKSVIDFVHSVLQVIDENIDESDKKVVNKKDFYHFLCSLDYIDVSYNLLIGGRELNALSPGEKGIVLLVFYLALSKNNTPIIIDQPEDNLDNQSVYSKLVPCICAAKQKRQIIIVTHNPNIAIACDAEQIVYCNMDKSTHKISYESGSIENSSIRQHVIDVLEGTEPAFMLRRRKYFSDFLK